MMIEVLNVRKEFNAGKPNEFKALRGISLAVGGNCLTVFKGPSGSGKTTLLSLIGCMARPTSGRIMIGAREITSLPERFLTDIRRGTFGFIFQQFNLIGGLTALENIMVPAYPLGGSHAALEKRAQRLLEVFGMAQKAASLIAWLSGGEAQRVAIARALINDPIVIIADEPTAHLDTKLSREFMEIMAGLKKEGKTVLIASHDAIVSESRLVDQVISLRDGQIEEA